MTSRQLLFRPDTPADRSLLRFGDFNYPVYLHETVSDDAPAYLRRRLGLVLQHLAAHGRTSVVKGCAGENQRWRRSPLGGNGGMQYYLWWTLHDGTILARAVRHHDNHEPLATGDSSSDYYQLNQSDINGSDESFVNHWC